MKLSNKTYDVIKNIILPLLIGGATFVLALGKAWPQLDEQTANSIALTLDAIATYISYVINQASKAFFKDKEIIETDINNKDVEYHG